MYNDEVTVSSYPFVIFHKNLLTADAHRVEQAGGGRLRERGPHEVRDPLERALVDLIDVERGGLE